MPAHRTRQQIRLHNIELAKRRWVRFVHEELRSLPSRYRFSSLTAFCKALRAASTGTPTGRKRRIEITRDLRAKVILMTKQRKPIKVIATATGLSTGSISSIRKKAKAYVRPPKRA